MNPNLHENPNNDYDCFIRRYGQPWTRGRVHHRQALELFLEDPTSHMPGETPVRISVPHADGGDFVAHFHRVNAAVCRYRDLHNQRVDIMMSSERHAAFINRVIRNE